MRGTVLEKYAQEIGEFAFNSLFEMRTTLRYDGAYNASDTFNSLFEMLRTFERLAKALGRKGTLSILYLRCLLRRLDEPEGVGRRQLSILYLRCVGEGALESPEELAYLFQFSI